MGNTTEHEFRFKPGKATWNGRDFHVSFGHGKHRSWSDAMTYGFISAGQGEWHTRTLDQLFIEARVFVHIPQHGYVGVGNVITEKTPVTEFTIKVDGDIRNILDMELDAEKMGHNAEDTELREYLVGIEWEYTRALHEGVWDKDMYANQNTVTRLRDEYTLETLKKEFGIVE